MFGFTSITFNTKGISEIVDLAVRAGVQGIEWGGRTQIIPGDRALAKEARDACAKAGLEIFSYGSYYHCDDNEDFAPILESARILGAPCIRIWAGHYKEADCSPEEFDRLVRNAGAACDMAAEHGILVAFEYHRKTMTETIDGAMRLMEALKRPNARCYWQPNPDITLEEQLREIACIAPYLHTVHAFSWEKGNVRLKLSEKHDVWEQYLAVMKKCECAPNLILEFCKDDDEDIFVEDCRELAVLNEQLKPLAVFLTAGENTAGNISRVYDRTAIDCIRRRVNLHETVISHDQLYQNREILAKAQYIFSTWGMPALSIGEIREYFPALRAVYYGAGSVQRFARPFLEAGVRVHSAWAANGVPVAEYTYAQILLANTGFFLAARKSRSKEGRNAVRSYTGSMPGNYDVKIGILGAGMIGSMVIELLRRDQVEILVYDPFLPQERADAMGVKLAGLEEIFEQCQVISCHIANLPETERMLKYEHFSRMLPNATFINTGRGAQVVEADLIRALQEVPTRTALLDVTFPEPPEEGSPFYEMDNVFLTPHIAGSKGNEVHRMSLCMAQECQRVLMSDRPLYSVTMKMLEHMA